MHAYLHVSRQFNPAQLSDQWVAEQGYPGWGWTRIDMERQTVMIEPIEQIEEQLPEAWRPFRKGRS